MAVADIETNHEVTPEPTVGDRLADVARHVSHVSHEARLMKSIATDAGEAGVYAVKRGLRRARRRIEALTDLRDDAAYYVKRQPFKAVGIAAGVGLMIGVVIGLVGRRAGSVEDAR